MNKNTPRAAAFIDGFNVYHSIDSKPHLHRHKWLNIKGLCEAFVPSSHELVSIDYFTAYSEWNQDKVARHRILVEIYRDLGVNVILGKFKYKTRRCRICHEEYEIPEEKRTDVNIATRLIAAAHGDTFDTAYLMSGDSDLVSAVEYVREGLKKRVVLIIPVGRKAGELTRACGGNDFRRKIKEKHLKNNQLPDPYISSTGKHYECPDTWK